jgi:hypothetical protein
MDLQQELDFLNNIILKLNTQGYGTNLLKDPLTESVKVALVAFKQRLENSNKNNIFNVMRNIFLTSGLDIYKKFPHGIVGQVELQGNVHWKTSKPLLMEEKETTTWVMGQNYNFINMDVVVSYSNGMVEISINSTEVLHHKLMESTQFYGQGGDFFSWLDHCLHQPMTVEINGITVGTGSLVWEPQPVVWTSVHDGNPWIEKLLYHWWFPESQRFFQIKLDDFGYAHHIILKIPCDFFHNSMAIVHNYFYCLNYFYKDSLPMVVDDSNFYRPITLNDNDTVASIDQVIYNGVALDPLKKNSEDFYYTRVDNGLFLQLSIGLNTRLNHEHITVDGYFFNKIMPLNNVMVDENNPGTIKKITAIKLVENTVAQDHLMEKMVDIFSNYIKNYNVHHHLDYIKNLWDYMKQVAQVMGTINGVELFNLELIVDKFSVVPEILFINNRSQLVDTYVWWIGFNNKKYNNLLRKYFNGILSYYGPRYRVIVN